MLEKEQIRKYCESININDSSLIDFIYKSQNEYNRSSYMDLKINRICNLKQKDFIDKILNNIINNKQEFFHKNIIVNVNNDDDIKNRISSKYKCNNELIEYICNLLNEYHDISYKNILLYSSTKFNVDERTIINRIMNFEKKVNSPLKPQNFILNLKWNLVRRNRNEY